MLVDDDSPVERTLSVGDTFFWRNEFDTTRPTLGALYGLVSVESVRRIQLAGQEREMYTLTHLQTGQNAMTPGWLPSFRELATPEEIDDALAKLAEPFSLDEAPAVTWNRRYRDLIRDMLEGTVVELALCARLLRAMEMEKELSFGERRIYALAVDVLTDEITFVTGAPREHVEAKLREAIG